MIDHGLWPSISFGWTIVWLIASIVSENWNSFLLTDILPEWNSCSKLKKIFKWHCFRIEVHDVKSSNQSKFVSSLKIYRESIYEFQSEEKVDFDIIMRSFGQNTKYWWGGDVWKALNCSFSTGFCLQTLILTFLFLNFDYPYELHRRTWFKRTYIHERN